WRVDSTSSLFDYDAGEGPETFVIPNFPAGPVTLADLPEDLAEQARSTCLEEGIEHEAAMSSCILDTVCGSDSASADARAQDIPVLHQPPGESDLVTGGAVELKPIPAVLDDQGRADPDDRCSPRARPAINLYREADTVLANALTTDGGEPGAYVSTDDAVSAEISSGTAVQSWLLVRQAGDESEVGLDGFVRFAQPILGVQLDAARLAPTDGILGGTETTYSAGEQRTTELGEDSFEISADRRSLSIHLEGTTLDHLRVITEAN
ncbi:MAG: hypothetical protein AAFY60_21350, partial [Myxococcota bacterium]